MTEEAELLFAQEVVDVFPGSCVVLSEIEVDALYKAYLKMAGRWDLPEGTDRREKALHVLRDVVASYKGDPIRVARAQAVLEKLEAGK